MVRVAELVVVLGDHFLLIAMPYPNAQAAVLTIDSNLAPPERPQGLEVLVVAEDYMVTLAQLVV